ncbi:MAG: hypothetical protein HYV54_02755 [Parcubacteria group bacterium]|nr:hypothetical protein [Parcubacteria group bacterium]
MPTITILKKPGAEKINIEIDVNRWEKIADALGFYKKTFLKTLDKSIKESKSGRVRKIRSLSELRHS